MRYFLFFILSFVIIGAKAQKDSVSSGRAIQFDGVNDYIQLGSHYHDLKLPITVSAWVKFEPLSLDIFPIFVTNDDTDFIYRGFEFLASRNYLVCQIGDGMGGNNPIYRRGLEANMANFCGDCSGWINLCVVMRSPTDASLYVNGVDISNYAVPIGQSNFPMAPSFSTDTAKIGSVYGNGVLYRSKAQLDEIRLWNRALTASEVQRDLCKKLSGNEAGLIGYWNFDETSGNIVFDKSPNHFDGALKGNPLRVFSGAPIGDDSKYQNLPDWTGKTFSFQDNNDLVSVSNIHWGQNGIHIYEVKNLPSQTGSLNANVISQPYFGIFTPDGNLFDITYTYKGSTSCKTFTRSNNSVSTWAKTDNPLIQTYTRIEIIRDKDNVASFDLGPDKILCDQTATTISTGITDPQFSVLWNTGQNTSTINVNQSGKYVAKVSGQCSSAVKDSVFIQFELTPPLVSLGDDQTLCAFKPITLTAINNSTGYQIKWQDNSTNPTYHPHGFGKYWVSVGNDCGIATDTIAIAQSRPPLGLIPNVITPNNGDDLNQYFKLDDGLKGIVSLSVLNRWGKEVYRSDSYQNDWDGGGLSAGVYFVIITGLCIDEVREILTILH